jgi:hypothetical protein
METFKELYEKSKSNKTVRKLETEFRELGKKGEFVLGRLKGITEIKSKVNEGTFNMYLFDTDTGPVKVILGTKADTDVAPLMVIDRVYRIEYEGKEKLGGGREMNLFKCEELGVVSEETGEIK